MKNLRTKLVILLMVAAIALTLVGCGGGDKDKFVGTWRADVDAAEFFTANFNEGLGDDELASYFNFDEFNFVMVFQFNEDDTFSMSVDEASMNTAVEAVRAQLRVGMTAYFEDLIASEGLDGMTVDDVLALSGITMDDMIEMSFSDALVDELIASFEVNGKWKAEGGKLYTTESVNDDIKDAGYDFYEIKDEGIELTEGAGAEDSMGIFPMLLVKAD